MFVSILDSNLYVFHSMLKYTHCFPGFRMRDIRVVSFMSTQVPGLHLG